MNGMFNGSLFRIYRSPDGAEGGDPGKDGEPGDDNADGDQGDAEHKDEATVEFETWLEKQPKDAQDEYNKLDEAGKAFFRNHSAGLRRALESERSTNKNAKAELKKLKEADDLRKKESMSELDRTKTERDEARNKLTGLEEKLKTERVESAVLFEAAKLGFANPADAIKLIDQGDLKYDPETGKVEGVGKALKALSTDKPYLLGKTDDKGKGKGIGNNTGDKGRKPSAGADERPFVQPGTHL